MARGGEDVVEFAVLLQHFYRDALDGIGELKSELENMTDELCRGAGRQLHASDTVLTLGYSHTIRRYLLAAAAAVAAAQPPSPQTPRRCFGVVVLEGAPGPATALPSSAALMVHTLADALRAEGVPVQVLPDSSAFAVMGLCTKVLLGAEGVLSNGGLLAAAGTRVVCVAARHFAIPVLVATTTLKMSPYYPSDALCTRLVRIARSGAQAMPWTTYAAPGSVLPMLRGRAAAAAAAIASSSSSSSASSSASPSASSATSHEAMHVLRVYAPVAEYVPPELVTLYATNDSEFTPSQVHRMVRANYSDVD